MPLSVFDLHCDTAYEMLVKKQPFSDNFLAISAKKAKDLQQYIQVMALWTDDHLGDEEGWQQLLRMYQNLLSDETVKSGRAKLCTACPAEEAGISLLLGIEDARVLCGKLERVEQLYQMGVRIITPLWSGISCIGGSHNTKEGLTDFGRCAIAAAVDLGMIADISHASERCADEILALAADRHRPVIASHSNAFDICPASRNLHSRQLRELLASGGVIGLNLCRHFIKADGEPTLTDLLRHIEYFLERDAENALCLGCDMDGAPLPAFCDSLAALPSLADRLAAHYPQALIEKIFFKNAFHFAEKYLLSAKNS